METAAEPKESAPETLEEGLRFSGSLLWRHQRLYFQRMVIQCWSQGHVPHYITSNPTIAHCQARIVLGWARDHLSTLALGARIHVIELGSGSGRFAYRFLRSLLPAWESTSLRGIRLRYVMTDFGAGHRDFWQGHPKLAPFVDSGVLDFAVFDPTEEDSLTLHHAGERLGRGDRPAR